MREDRQPSASWYERLHLEPLDAAPLPSGLRFELLRPGIEIARLYGDDKRGPSAAYLRYAPGASLPSHVHNGYEHIFVLQGEQSDEHGSYGPGSCLISAPGSRHRVQSATGCLVLAVWCEPVAFDTEAP